MSTLPPSGVNSLTMALMDCTTPRLKLIREGSISQLLRRFCQPRMASKYQSGRLV